MNHLTNALSKRRLTSATWACDANNDDSLILGNDHLDGPDTQNKSFIEALEAI